MFCRQYPVEKGDGRRQNWRRYCQFKGIKPYDGKLLELRLESESAEGTVQSRQPCGIFCELIDLRDKKWQNSIEVSAPKILPYSAMECFVSCFKIYDQLKFEQEFYDIGLVDIGKLREPGWKREPGREVITDNPYARVL